MSLISFFLALPIHQQWAVIAAITVVVTVLITVLLVSYFTQKRIQRITFQYEEQKWEIQRQQAEQQSDWEHALDQRSDELAQIQQRFQEVSVDRVRWQERASALSQRLNQLDSQHRAETIEQQTVQAQLNQKLQEIQGALARERQSRLLEQRHAEEKLALLESNKALLLTEFEDLSRKIFEQKQQQFSEQSERGIHTLLTPFREQLDGLRKKVEEVYVSDSRDRASLKTQLSELQRLNHKMSEEAQALTTALRGENKIQGNWGELVLETVLERSGLREGEEYVREQVHSSHSGQRYRPDVIINLPDNKHIVVDAKVSLNAYSDYVNATTDSDKSAALKRHLASVRQHIRGLSDKAYQQLQGINAPDFVFLFMPIEPSFTLAFQHDERLFSDAFEQKVVVVTPTTLLASLRTVSSLWAIERRNRNTEKLAEQATKLYDKLVVVVERFEKLGIQLGTVNKTYDEAWSSMKTGRSNLLSQADQFRKLGVRVKKELDSPLVEEANAEAELHQILDLESGK